LRALEPLIGEPLTYMFRYAGYQKFEFGIQRPAKNRKGEAITVADLGFVVACPWRITGPEGCIVSSADFGPDRERRDAGASGFYHLVGADPPFVEAVEVDEDGTLRFVLSAGYTIYVEPEIYEPDDEQWRFMQRDRRRKQIVMGGDGLLW